MLSVNFDGIEEPTVRESNTAITHLKVMISPENMVVGYLWSAQTGRDIYMVNQLTTPHT
ncbi:uncharacterized protein PHALS_08968 [Plasmopara halstedii]|uniref:Uncharacterized protein n=1 Tax=Plasmopara halstedii TaxID=4781 RepID=A0A0N7L4K4_PLAHL|nr:uncharacterized protein PHALS_08968 [Plasmopara halstedii]CEG38923.1 hypothetical protein PHALS_08968 [Plasmopara halstedii]|eukprot:XP_024575292.1 hypothetical protein PHALS_08968 [Plasmopara halstedii]